MSTNVLTPIVILNSVSMTADVESNPIHIQYEDNIGLEFVWTGTPTGTFGVSVSNSATLSATGGITGGTWTPLSLTSPDVPAASGSAGNGFIDLNQLGAAFLKVTYSASSGTGSLTVTMTGKPV
jgi:hypothetical protein